MAYVFIQLLSPTESPSWLCYWCIYNHEVIDEDKQTSDPRADWFQTTWVNTQRQAEELQEQCQWSKSASQGWPRTNKTPTTCNKYWTLYKHEGSAVNGIALLLQAADPVMWTTATQAQVQVFLLFYFPTDRNPVLQFYQIDSVDGPGNKLPLYLLYFIYRTESKYSK